MAKAGRGSDQFMLRLPDGLRDRIKAYAERHGRSMNAEIVRVLEREYPEPWSVDGRMSDLLEMLRLLKAGTTDERIDNLTHEVEETVLGVITGRMRGLDEKARSRIQHMWHRWQEDRAQDSAYLDDLDQEEIDQLEISGRTEKFEPPAPQRKRLGNLSDEEFEAYKLGYDAALKARIEQPAVDEDPFEDEK